MKTFYYDKVAAVTGGASGIGKALIVKLAKAGAIAWALDRDEAALKALADEGKKYNLTIKTAVLDVTDPKAVRETMRRIAAESKTLDLWFNNAGISGMGSFLMQTPEEFTKVVALNLEAVVAGTREALKLMENQGTGVVVNTASVAGHLSAPFLAAYCTTKHAVVGFTRAVREEMRLMDSPVRVVLASPGFVDTKMIARGEKLGFPDWLKWALSTPDAVAEEILTGIRKGAEEIFPTQNGRWMLRAYRLAPRATMRGSKVLLTQSLKDLILNRFKVG